MSLIQDEGQGGVEDKVIRGELQIHPLSLCLNLLQAVRLYNLKLRLIGRNTVFNLPTSMSQLANKKQVLNLRFSYQLMTDNWSLVTANLRLPVWLQLCLSKA